MSPSLHPSRKIVLSLKLLSSNSSPASKTFGRKRLKRRPAPTTRQPVKEQIARPVRPTTPPASRPAGARFDPRPPTLTPSTEQTCGEAGYSNTTKDWACRASKTLGDRNLDRRSQCTDRVLVPLTGTITSPSSHRSAYAAAFHEDLSGASQREYRP